MRIYLDTNILSFFLTERRDEISCPTEEGETARLPERIADKLRPHTGTHIPVPEGQADTRPRNVHVRPSISEWPDETGIGIAQVDAGHFRRFSVVSLADGHRDPNGRLIMAQAMPDKATLVNSDRKSPAIPKARLRLPFNWK